MSDNDDPGLSFTPAANAPNWKRPRRQAASTGIEKRRQNPGIEGYGRAALRADPNEASNVPKTNKRRRVLDDEPTPDPVDQRARGRGGEPAGEPQGVGLASLSDRLDAVYRLLEQSHTRAPQPDPQIPHDDLANVRQDVQVIGQSLAGATGRIEDLRTNVTTLGENFTDLRGVVDAVQQDVGGVRTGMGSLDNRMETLQQGTQDLRALMTQIGANLRQQAAPAAQGLAPQAPAAAVVDGGRGKVDWWPDTTFVTAEFQKRMDRTKDERARIGPNEDREVKAIIGKFGIRTFGGKRGYIPAYSGLKQASDAGIIDRKPILRGAPPAPAPELARGDIYYWVAPQDRPLLTASKTVHREQKYVYQGDEVADRELCKEMARYHLPRLEKIEAGSHCEHMYRYFQVVPPSDGQTIRFMEPAANVSQVEVKPESLGKPLERPAVTTEAESSRQNLAGLEDRQRGQGRHDVMHL